MATAKQTEANQRNARKSTGPRTPKGKAAVRLNAMKHGLLAQQVVLPDEDGAAFSDLRDRLSEDLEPVGELETLLADRIIAIAWRLQRVCRVEVGILIQGYYGELAHRARMEASGFTEEIPIVRPLEPLSSDRTITDEEAYEEATARAEEAKSVMRSETATLGEVFIQDAQNTNALSKLSRYEAGIERGLYRALREFHDLQEARMERDGPAPPEEDVDAAVAAEEED